METALFMVASPLQLINAVEARCHFGIGEEGSHLVLFPFLYRADNVEVLRRLVQDQRWGSVREMMPSGPASAQASGWSWAALHHAWKRLREVDSVARVVQSVDAVFLGNYRSQYMRHLAHRVHHERAVVLDDGMSTLTIVKDRREATPGAAELRPVPMRRRVETLLGGRFGEIPALTWFTAYDVDAPPGDQVVPNAYAEMRRLATVATRSEDAYFLGSPLAGPGRYTLDQYVALLLRTAAHLGSHVLKYLPHRAELPATLREIERRTPFRIHRTDLPIEWELVRVAERPAMLCGWYTSALENCHLIFGPSLSILSFRLPDPPVGSPPPAHWDDIQRAYTYFESRSSASFRVVPLDGAAMPTTGSSEREVSG